MAISTDQEETSPPVPHKNDRDAPPSYAPTDGPSTSTPTTHYNSHAPPMGSPTAAILAYSNPTPAQNGQSSRPPDPIIQSSNEISIPFYPNPPPRPDLPDHKRPILSDIRRPSKEMDRMPPFACLTLHSNDKLGSTNLSADITNDLDGVIRSKWAKGVKQWAHEDGGWCWQLQGKPCKSYFISLPSAVFPSSRDLCTGTGTDLVCRVPWRPRYSCSRTPLSASYPIIEPRVFTPHLTPIQCRERQRLAHPSQDP